LSLLRGWAQSNIGYAYWGFPTHEAYDGQRDFQNRHV